MIYFLIKRAKKQKKSDRRAIKTAYLPKDSLKLNIPRCIRRVNRNSFRKTLQTAFVLVLQFGLRKKKIFVPKKKSLKNLDFILFPSNKFLFFYKKK